jgi:hypothetical protein
VGKCNVFNVAYGTIPMLDLTGTILDSRCNVHHEKMFTIIVAMSWEHDLVKNNVKNFRSMLGTEWSHYFLLFIPTNKTAAETICDYAFAADAILLRCVEACGIVDVVASRRANSIIKWFTTIGVNHSPYKTSDHIIDRHYYTQQNVDQFLMTEALKSANESAGNTFYEYPSSQLMDIGSRYVTRSSSSVLVDQLTTGFISCFEKPKLKFQVYFEPFDMEVWMSITLCCTIITGVIHIYNRIFHLSTSFSPIFFFMSTLVEEPYSVPSAIWNSRVFKIITLAWVLTAIVFTNLYIGLVISDVTAPVRGEIFNTFDKVLAITDKTIPSPKMLFQLVEFWKWNYTTTVKMNSTIHEALNKGCEDIYVASKDTLYGYDSKDYETYHAQFRTSESFALLHKPLEKCEEYGVSNEIRKRFLSLPWMYDVFHRLTDGIFSSLHFHMDLRYLRCLYALVSPKHRLYPKNPNIPPTKLEKIPSFLSAAIEKELVACERSIFIGERKALNNELSYLKTNYPRKHFYISNDTLESSWSTPIIWNFMKPGNSKVPRYFKQLLEAGGRDVLLRLRKHTYYLKRRIGTQFVQDEMLKEVIMGMSGSIQTIFIILIVSLSIATMVFLLELLHKSKVIFTMFATLIQHCIKSLKAMQICTIKIMTVLLKTRPRMKRSNHFKSTLVNQAIGTKFQNLKIVSSTGSRYVNLSIR